MTTGHGTLPTLTEVIEIAPDALAPTEPLPLAPESVPLEPARAAAAPAAYPKTLPRLGLLGPEEAARIVDAVVERLQPRLEAWVREQFAPVTADALQQVVRDAVQASVDAAAADMARRLRLELPALARSALEDVRADGFES